jgi:uncharacterized protein (DUF952 family)
MQDGTARPHNTIVYKVALAAAWENAIQLGRFYGSDDDRRDGFIHLSTAEQLHPTLEKHFLGKSGILLIAFSTASLAPSLRWEVSRGGEQFPHLYADLPTNLALWVRQLTVGSNSIPDYDPAWLTC